jgi:hypothetical protein
MKIKKGSGRLLPAVVALKKKNCDPLELLLPSYSLGDRFFRLIKVARKLSGYFFFSGKTQ